MKLNVPYRIAKYYPSGNVRELYNSDITKVAYKSSKLKIKNGNLVAPKIIRRFFIKLQDEILEGKKITAFNGNMEVQLVKKKLTNFGKNLMTCKNRGIDPRRWYPRVGYRYGVEIKSSLLNFNGIRYKFIASRKLVYRISDIIRNTDKEYLLSE
jgi:hypothetical protein